VLTPTRLVIQGFRGFLRRQTFDFDTPAVILFGENRCGKSSALNALEWCLFGDEIEGVKSGIRERKDWEVANRYLTSPTVSVELHIDTSEGPLVIRRTRSKASGRAKSRQLLELTLPDGEVVRDASAEQHLAQFLQATFRDFMTMVYQHQETIRHIVMQKPEECNDAIDRLLGLSGYRNLLTAIKNADLQKSHKIALGKIDEFGQRVETLISHTADQLREKHGAAVEAEVPDRPLTDQVALEVAGEAVQALADFGKETGIEIPNWELTKEWRIQAAVEKSAQDTITSMRGRLPDAEKQEGLFDRQTQATELKGKLTNNKKSQEHIARAIRDLDTEHGGQQSIATQIGQLAAELKNEKERLREANSRVALVREAIQYLEKAKADELAGRCPLCTNEAPNLLPVLRTQLEQALQGRVVEIEKAIRSRSGQLETLERVRGQYEEADKEQARLVDALLPLGQKTGELLGKVLEVTDDPVALLATEEKQIDDRLRELRVAIKKRQDRLDEISKKFIKVRKVCEFLELEEKKRIIDHIEESAEWQALQEEGNRMAQYVTDVEAIKSAITTASNEEGNQKLSAAEKAIDEFFRLLTKQPAGKGIRLTAQADAKTGRNAYAFTDQDGKDLVPVLSQGDMNCLALAIFLGLACSSAETATLKFVLLDDPSQSLGSEYKEQLVSVLDRVASSRRLIVATMDSEFCNGLTERLTKSKTLYRFKSWTEVDGARADRA
jgi:DNA repair exonuclease SbcCD ATPase subunit